MRATLMYGAADVRMGHEFVMASREALKALLRP